MARRAFLRDSLGVAASQYLARALLFARGIASAVALGPMGFGAWNALNLILDYGTYASLGAVQGLDLSLPPAAARGEAQRARRAMSGAWSVILLGGAAFATAVVLVLAAGSWLGSTGWGWGAPALMLAATLLQLAIHYHVSALRAHGDFGTVSLALAIQALIGGGLGAATVWVWGVWGLLVGWLAGSSLALMWLRRSPSRPPLRPSAPGEGWSLALTGLPMFTFFALTLVIRSLDRVALVRFAGNGALGHYSLGLIASGLVLYLPESAAAVLFPRVAAAAEGARDPELTRHQVLRAQRGLSALLPVVVGPGVLWAAPVVHRLLPAYAEGLEPLRVLVAGALVVSMATLPAYYLLGSRRGPSLVAVAAAAALVSASAILTVAGRDPRPVSVAWAATVGYAAFAIPILAMATPRLATSRREQITLAAGTLGPTAWAVVLVLALSRAADATALGAAWRSIVYLAAYLPIAFALARGLGIGREAREWLRGR